LREGFTIAETDASRPWGAFLRVVNEQADKFIQLYYDGVDLPPHARAGEKSPKILVIAPGQRLSWQHHDRRSELWRLVGGQAGVYLSPTNEQPSELHVMQPGEMIELPEKMRHRLVGLDTWGAIAEIWVHNDPQQLSDERDIQRHQDDYSR
jgi:mannose-6-phosphate isomerase-like protein (cupin superfamily)